MAADISFRQRRYHFFKTIDLPVWFIEPVLSDNYGETQVRRGY